MICYEMIPSSSLLASACSLGFSGSFLFGDSLVMCLNGESGVGPLESKDAVVHVI